MRPRSRLESKRVIPVSLRNRSQQPLCAGARVLIMPRCEIVAVARALKNGRRAAKRIAGSDRSQTPNFDRLFTIERGLYSSRGFVISFCSLRIAVDSVKVRRQQCSMRRGMRNKPVGFSSRLLWRAGLGAFSTLSQPFLNRLKNSSDGFFY